MLALMPLGGRTTYVVGLGALIRSRSALGSVSLSVLMAA